MKKMFFGGIILIVFLSANLKLESRQYNIDYLMDLIEAGDDEGIRQFFSQPKYVTKIKHIIEFTEIFRSKLEERFGYKPSYREAYDYFKANLSNMSFPKEQKQQLLSIFKEIVKQSEQAEQAERKGCQFNSASIDFRGSVDSNIDIPDQIVIAYNEALAGCLMCIIPSPISYAIGGTLIGDAVIRTYNHLEKRNSQSAQEKPYDYSDCESSTGKDNYDRSHDHDSWDKAPDFR